jgi:hypothetical protein
MNAFRIWGVVGGPYRGPLQKPSLSLPSFSHRWQPPTRSIRTKDAGIINCVIQNPGLGVLIGFLWGHEEGSLCKRGQVSLGRCASDSAPKGAGQPKEPGARPPPHPVFVFLSEGTAQLGLGLQRKLLSRCPSSSNP